MEELVHDVLTGGCCAYAITFINGIRDVYDFFDRLFSELIYLSIGSNDFSIDKIIDRCGLIIGGVPFHDVENLNSELESILGLCPNDLRSSFAGLICYILFVSVSTEVGLSFISLYEEGSLARECVISTCINLIFMNCEFSKVSRLLSEMVAMRDDRAVCAELSRMMITQSAYIALPRSISLSMNDRPDMKARDKGSSSASGTSGCEWSDKFSLKRASNIPEPNCKHLEFTSIQDSEDPWFKTLQFGTRHRKPGYNIGSVPGTPTVLRNDKPGSSLIGGDCSNMYDTENRFTKIEPPNKPRHSGMLRQQSNLCNNNEVDLGMPEQSTTVFASSENVLISEGESKSVDTREICSSAAYDSRLESQSNDSPEPLEYKPVASGDLPSNSLKGTPAVYSRNSISETPAPSVSSTEKLPSGKARQKGSATWKSESPPPRFSGYSLEAMSTNIIEQNFTILMDIYAPNGTELLKRAAEQLSSDAVHFPAACYLELCRDHNHGFLAFSDSGQLCDSLITLIYQHLDDPKKASGYIILLTIALAHYGSSMCDLIGGSLSRKLESLCLYLNGSPNTCTWMIRHVYTIEYIALHERILDGLSEGFSVERGKSQTDMASDAWYGLCSSLISKQNFSSTAHYPYDSLIGFACYIALKMRYDVPIGYPVLYQHGSSRMRDGMTYRSDQSNENLSMAHPGMCPFPESYCASGHNHQTLTRTVISQCVEHPLDQQVGISIHVPVLTSSTNLFDIVRKFNEDLMPGDIDKGASLALLMNSTRAGQKLELNMIDRRVSRTQLLTHELAAVLQEMGRMAEVCAYELATSTLPPVILPSELTRSWCSLVGFVNELTLYEDDLTIALVQLGGAETLFDCCQGVLAQLFRLQVTIAVLSEALQASLTLSLEYVAGFIRHLNPESLCLLNTKSQYFLSGAYVRFVTSLGQAGSDTPYSLQLIYNMGVQRIIDPPNQICSHLISKVCSNDSELVDLVTTRVPDILRNEYDALLNVLMSDVLLHILQSPYCFDTLDFVGLIHYTEAVTALRRTGKFSSKIISSAHAINKLILELVGPDNALHSSKPCLIRLCEMLRNLN